MKTGSKLGIATAKINIANLCYSLKKYDEALKMHLEAIALMKELGDKRGVANCYINIGNCYNDQGRSEEALSNYLSGLKMFDEMKSLHGLASANNNIGRVYMKQKKYSEARPYLLKAMAYSKQSANKDYIKASYMSFSELDQTEALFGNVSVLRKAELLQNALENYKVYIGYRDSLVNEEVAQKTLEQKMQYDFDKKESLAKVGHEKLMAEAEADKRRQKYVSLIALITAVAVGVIALIVFRTLKVTRKQKALIEIKNKQTEQQKLVIEEKQKEVLDSIRYAKRIQQSLLASEKYIERKLEGLKKK